jgi:hypothetical protein
MQQAGKSNLNPSFQSNLVNSRIMQNYNRLVFALLLFFISTGLYLFLPQYFYVGDDLQAAMAIDHGITGHYYYHPAGGRIYDPSQPTIDPDKTIDLNTRYYLEYPISVLVGRLWQAFGWSDNSITPVLAFRALVGGLGVLFVFLAICETGCDPRLAVLASLGFGVSAAYWTYSTHIYQTISMGAALAFGFYLLVRLRKSGKGIGWGGKAALAAILWFAALNNITAIITFLPFGLAIAFVNPNPKLSGKIKEFVLFGIVSAVLGGAIILFIFTNPTAPRSANPFAWQDAPVAGDAVYGVDPVKDTFRTILGFARSAIVFPGGPNSMGSMQAYWDSIDSGGRIRLLVFYGVALIFFFVPVVAMISQWRKFQHGWLWITIVVWFVIYVGFNWFWEPGAVKYWLVPLMCWWVALALFLNHISITHWYRLSVSFAALFVIAVFAVNFAVQFLPESRRENDISLTVAEALSTASNPNDLFVTDRMDIDFYLAYFANRNVVSIDLIIEATGSGEAAARVVKDHLDRHRADNGQIYVYTYDPANLPSLAQAVGLEDESQFETAWTFPGLTIYRAVY